MSTHEAGCACGQLRLLCEGPPVRVSMCHCLACQRRTGSVFGVQAWFPRQKVGEPSGKVSTFVRTADSGRRIAFGFCPECGATVFWVADLRPDLVAVAVGAFADPDFMPPQHSVWENRRHDWTTTSGEARKDLPAEGGHDAAIPPREAAEGDAAQHGGGGERRRSRTGRAPA